MPKLLDASIWPLSTASIPALIISETYAAEFKYRYYSVPTNISGISIPINLGKPM